MSSAFLLRLLLAILLCILGWAAYRLANWHILRRARNKELGLESLVPGVPSILYFTTPMCVPCKTVQRPAILRLQERLGDRLRVVEIDATARPDLADYWGVLSVPTTFIIDGQGRPRGVNHGVTSAEKLFAQLKEIAGDHWPGEPSSRLSLSHPQPILSHPPARRKS